ncbi:hypothetical protein BDV38DRAFT_248918 [Aspergillus pseudotamarii]|uniref:Uncharacterized protein n=1 Tax=Aspergillus pseudotamarii TaxID=132259 RepID=A0A5N6SU74_ASPPS|nr:uncharacterized protein BDV38DRAFT_248918 [Aspergillus pseudotamarii]KAE8136694.1 hypothetical protein BDV38DRAFT_248918 [Aspergillus pseudotamarii]
MDYLESLKKPNVTPVLESIKEITPSGGIMLGVAAHGFPNYFMLLGPNSPLAKSPLILCIEAQGHHIAKFLNWW